MQTNTIIDKVVITDTLPGTKDYWELFETTGWNEEYNFTAQELEKAIKTSWYLASLYDSEKLVGFGRVISDGIHHALIVDLIIHPDYQGKGLGSELLKRLVQQCRENNIRDIQLFSAKGNYSFYEKFGFEKRPMDAPGMQLKQT